MRKKYHIFLILILFSNLSFSQNIKQSFLEYYDLSFINPSLIKAEKLFQLDLSGYTNNRSLYKRGFMLNSIYNVNNNKSRIRFSFEYNKIGDLSTKYKISQYSKLFFSQLGYSHSFNINEDLNILCGANLSFINYSSIVKNLYMNSEPQIFSQNKTVKTNFGLAGDFKDLIVGVSIRNILWDEHSHLDIDSTIIKKSFGMKYGRIHLVAKHNFYIKHEISISPQVEYNKYEKLNLGLFLEYKEIMGVGIMYNLIKLGIDQEMFKFIGSINLFDRIKFITLLYPDYYSNYYYNESKWNLIGQLRINF